MSNESDEVGSHKSEDRLEMDFRVADFPSDALSVKRFRKLFPQHFDGSDRIADGYTSNNFFYPTGEETPSHLLRLTELICDERTVASGAYYRQYLTLHPTILNAEDLDCIDESKRRLEESYQLFKLADSREAARLLIDLVEEEGQKQARRDQAKGR